MYSCCIKRDMLIATASAIKKPYVPPKAGTVRTYVRK